MSRKYCKRSDQEWFSLIQDCKASSLTIRVWCVEHGITQKALAYYTKKLRQKGYFIPPKARGTVLPDRQELFCFGFADEKTADIEHPADAPAERAIRIDFHGMLIKYQPGSAGDDFKYIPCAAERVLGDLSGVSKV